jgi:signal transduction histidine kinase
VAERHAPDEDDGSADPSAEARPGEARRWEVHPRRPSVPRSFQARLTIAFVSVVALTLGLVAPVMVNRLDDYFRQQEEEALRVHATATAAILTRFITDEVGNKPVVAEVNGQLKLNPTVESLLVERGLLSFTANSVAQADVTLVFGTAHTETDGELTLDPDPHLTYLALLTAPAGKGQARDPAIDPASRSTTSASTLKDWGLQVTLRNPYTSRASTLAAITGLLLVMALAAVLVAVLVAAFFAHRFATPVTRLTDASRRLAEGDFTSRVNLDAASGSLEIQALAVQFNRMAGRLEESVEIIRRDRDRSRDFLADVSHELRTPIAAMRTFIELLQGPAGRDPEARTEFLDSSAVQLDRLDWLAQNLLELSKLDSGLVLLELRPDDVRATIESAVEQQMATAERRGITLDAAVPDRPLRISHDAPRVGQVVSNLVGNALKFTPRGGEVHVVARREPDGGARIEVSDTGVGIHPAELPRIFDRFYRGSQANEARGTGSGLGLAIVKSIVDMHHGTIEVESRVGRGSRFTVTLPRDPREAQMAGPSTSTDGSGSAAEDVAGDIGAKGG